MNAGLTVSALQRILFGLNELGVLKVISFNGFRKVESFSNFEVDDHKLLQNPLRPPQSRREREDQPNLE